MGRPGGPNHQTIGVRYSGGRFRPQTADHLGYERDEVVRLAVTTVTVTATRLC
jgi:hypothetical protein